MSDKRKQKLLIIIGSIAIVICIFIFIKLNSDAKDAYIVVNNNTIGYINQKWYNVKNDAPIFDDYRFDVYNNEEYKGKYELRYFNSIWYYFDSQKESHKFEGNIFATTGDRKVSLEKVEKQSLTDNDLININKALKDIKISDTNEILTSEKLEFDFDNDSKKEIIYSVNNINVDDYSDNYFTAVIYSKDNKSKLLIYNTGTSEYKDDLYIYSLDYIVKLNNNFNLIMTAAKNLDINSTTSTVYKYNEKTGELSEEKSIEKNFISLEHKNNDNYGLTIALIVIAILFIGTLTFTIIKKKKAEQNEI